MIIQALKVPDETYEIYSDYNRADPKAAMAAQLNRFRAVDPTSRILLIPKNERIELERLLGTDLESAAQLVTLVKNLLAVRVGGAEVILTKDQAQRIAEQAKFQGLTTQEYIQVQGEWAMQHVAGGGIA